LGMKDVLCCSGLSRIARFTRSTGHFNSVMAPAWILRTLVVLACLTTSVIWLRAEGPVQIQFTQSAPQVAVFDFVEVTASVKTPTVGNPFAEASITGEFQQAGSATSIPVEGFCDSADGSTFRIRFMPSKSGVYTYHVAFKAGAETEAFSGKFTALDQHRKGPIRVDPDYPWHFIWEGTNEHYFFNGTTAFFLMGWRDERTIQYCIDRLASLKVNRMRVDIYGRSFTFYGENVMNGPSWTIFLNPWPAQAPDDFYHPGFDYSRFDVPYWQRFDRMLRYARERGMIISLVLDMGDARIHPAAGGDDERRYIHYAVARVAGFSNITWDLGDDLDVYRDEKWAHETGTMIEQLDPYHHLASSHPTKIEHQDRASSWFGFVCYQEWSRKQHTVMLESRKLQEKAGRIVPQTNEEYGYEDHYPGWGANGIEPDSDKPEVLRRTAWDIYMAGAYQTTGESSRRGTNVWPDTGGGWVNGRGDDTQTMLIGYGHIVEFFTSFEWWKTNPHDELVDQGDYCLSDPGHLYAVYLPHGGKVTVKLEPGSYRGEWFNALSGQRIPLAEDATGISWTSPNPPDDSSWNTTHDWALLLQKR
jgi:hypothetical protein